MIIVLKILAVIVSLITGLFITLAFQGIVDFLTQVFQIELGKESAIVSMLHMGILISIIFGVYIGRKFYRLLTTKPNFYSIKKSIIRIIITLLIASSIFAISFTSVISYLGSLNLSSDLHGSIQLNMFVKLLFLSFVFSFLISPSIIKK